MLHPESLRLSVDKMLARLGRKLLILGIDTKVRADGETLREFLDTALLEDRIVITTSRQTYRTVKETKRYSRLKLIFAREGDQGALLEKLKSLGIVTPRHLVLTRCTVCNLRLKEVSLREVYNSVPEHVRWTYEKLWLCPGCGRVYWPGSHYRSMFQSVRRYISS